MGRRRCWSASPARPPDRPKSKRHGHRQSPASAAFQPAGGSPHRPPTGPCRQIASSSDSPFLLYQNALQRPNAVSAAEGQQGKEVQAVVVIAAWASRRGVFQKRRTQTSALGPPAARLAWALVAVMATGAGLPAAVCHRSPRCRLCGRTASRRKFLQPLGVFGLPRVGPEPGVVQRHVGDGAVGIAVIQVVALVTVRAVVGRTVVDGILGAETVTGWHALWRNARLARAASARTGDPPRRPTARTVYRSGADGRTDR